MAYKRKPREKKDLPRIPMEGVLATRNYAYPSHKEIYLCFIFWCTIPPTLRNKSKQEKIELGFDDSLHPIMNLKTQKQFAKYMGISEDTLSIWKSKERFDGDLKMARESGIIARYKNRIDESFSEKTIEYADAARVKLWHELYYNHVDKVVVRHEGDVKLKLEQDSNLFNLDDIFPLALGRVCARQGLDLSKVQYKLQNSYYKRMEGAEDVEIIKEFKFPSQVPYDFDELENSVKAHDKETLKLDKLPEEDKEMSDVKKRMMAKLAEMKEAEKVELKVKPVRVKSEEVQNKSEEAKKGATQLEREKMAEVLRQLKATPTKRKTPTKKASTKTRGEKK